MELRDLRAFVELSHTLHFGHAAERLNVTQSALSKQISRLEEDFGGALFVRTPQGTSLTPLGRSVVDDAGSIVAAAARLKSNARSTAAGRGGALRIGFGSSTRRLIPRIVQGFRIRMPSVHIDLRDLSTIHQIEAIRAGTLDVGFVRLPAPEGWCSMQVTRERLVAVLPEHFATSDDLKALASRPLVLIDRRHAPAFRDHALAYLRRRGFVDVEPQDVSDMPTALTVVEAGVGWTVVPSSSAEFVGIGCRILPLEGADAEWEVGLVRPAGRSAPVIEAFWEIVLTVV